MKTNEARKNTRTTGSASAYTGCIGLPDTNGPMLGDGGLFAFARRFNERFDEMAATSHPELRSFAKAERVARR